MNLQTNIPLTKQSNHLIDYNSNLLLLGSCFVENIGEKLSYFKFLNIQNPFGILFQPKAVETLVSNAANKKAYTEKDVFFHNEQWHCFEAHSKLSASTQKELLHVLNSQIQLTNQQISQSTHIVITLGTAWVYRFIESDRIVANCHKVPQKKFKKELLSVEEVMVSLQNIIDIIRDINLKASIIFTVSPVRHLKDGFVENTQSKAHLITAIHKIINDQLSINNCKLFYFPSFELMMDELRDYRFYAEDMLHPNQTAINYIWEKFKEVWISDTVFNVMDKVEVIQKGLQHKPFNPNTEAHKEFLLKLQKKKSDLLKTYPQIVF